MPRWKIDPVWNQSVMGVSESYITGVVSNTSLATDLSNLIAARANLLFAGYHQFVGIRITKLADDPNIPQAGRESRVYLPGDNELDSGGKFTLPATGSRTALTGAIETPDQLRSVLQYRVKFGDTRSTIRYLSGIPDGVSVTEPATFTFSRNTDWGNRFKAFSDLLVARYYVLALSNTGNFAPVQAAKLTLAGAAPAALVVSVETADAKTVTLKNRLKLSGFRRKKEKPGASLNGTFYIDAISTTLFTGMTSYTLRGTEGNDPADWKVLGKVRVEGYEYASIQKVDPYRVGIRQRGRPSLALRGRRVTRPSLDP